MRLLVCTQAVDRNDPVLGFFHGWLCEFGKHFESVTVLCLREGEHALPANVRVITLGQGRVIRAWNLLRCSFALQEEYGAALVHMSQEFVLASGWLWRLLGKRVYLWRNHYQGSLFTDASALFCTKIFCTSKFSYTAKYKKTVLMPVGVDTAAFKPLPGIARKPRSILFLSRMAPSKRPELLIEALTMLQTQGIAYVASLYGSPAPGDETYYERLTASATGLPVEFHPAVPNHQTPEVYSRHEVFVNCSPSGMFDKTLFEAAACGCVVLASSEDIKESEGDHAYFSDAQSLARQLKKVFASPEESTEAKRQEWSALARRHNLSNLGVRLRQEMAQ